MLWKASCGASPRRRRPPTTGARATASAPCSWSTARRPPPSSPPGWAISPAAVRRHLDALVGAGRLEERLVAARRTAAGAAPRDGSTSPTPGARRFPHAYDDLAADRAALRRRVRRARTPSGRCAEQQLAGLEARASSARRAGRQRPCRCPGRPGPGPGRGAHRPRATLPRPRRSPVGGQLCQHHCPVAHVAARVPAAVRGRDRGDRAAGRHPRAAAGHDRPRRRDLHHTHPRPRPAGEQNGP